MEKIVTFVPMEKKLLWKEEETSVLYYDIETTGLSARNSMIYMIGVGYYQKDGYEIVQFFANDAREESAIILEFLSVAKEYDCLVSFNGDQFDMPFIQKRMDYLDIPKFDEWVRWESLDIYKIVRKYAKRLGLQNGKQKTVEQFLGIYRQDIYNGGELIEFYRNYVISKELDLRGCLLLHNLDDMKGLFLITDILSYCDIFDGKWEIKTWKATETLIEIRCELKNAVPNPWNRTCSDGEIEGKGRQMLVKLCPRQMDLKLFYQDYKNYYYLPMEDMAVHQSVASYVDKEFRKKATKETCYTKHSLLVLRNHGAEGFHDLKETYKSKEIYVNVREILEGLNRTREGDLEAEKQLKNFILLRLNSLDV